MTLLIQRVELFDSAYTFDDPQNKCPLPDAEENPIKPLERREGGDSVAIQRVASLKIQDIMPLAPLSDSPNPHEPALLKYWNQRTRLFSRFERGIQLDTEGWYSVTPEQIAHHVSKRMVDLTSPQAVILDAFCGCGGNAIAMAHYRKVICVDVSLERLQRAAHNAAIYEIPPDRICFIQANALFVLEYAYCEGNFCLDQPISDKAKMDRLLKEMPKPVPPQTIRGYRIGGIELLPRRIDAIFMDPPWGGVDYNHLKKYRLERDMKIRRPGQSFFDEFGSSGFNGNLNDDYCVNGAELLTLAAKACSLIAFDVPRNTSPDSIARAALQAGWQGNCKLEEHCLNGRLKTVTAWFGTDWRCLKPSVITMPMQPLQPMWVPPPMAYGHDQQQPVSHGFPPPQPFPPHYGGFPAPEGPHYPR